MRWLVLNAMAWIILILLINLALAQTRMAHDCRPPNSKCHTGGGVPGPNCYYWCKY